MEQQLGNYADSWVQFDCKFSTDCGANLNRSWPDQMLSLLLSELILETILSGKCFECS